MSPDKPRQIGQVSFRHPRPITNVQFTKDEKHLVTTAKDGVRVWLLAPESRSLLRWWPTASAAALHVDGNRIAILHSEGVEIWGLASKRGKNVWKGRADRIYALRFLEKGSALVMVLRGQTDLAPWTVRLIDTVAGQITKEMRIPFGEAGMDLSNTGRYLIAHHGKTVTLWDLLLWKQKRIPVAVDGFTTFAFTPDDRRLFIANGYSVSTWMALWLTSTGRRLVKVPGYGFGRTFGAAVFTADGRHLVGTGECGGVWRGMAPSHAGDKEGFYSKWALRFYDARTLAARDCMPSDRRVEHFAVHPKGGFVVVATDDGVLRRVDLKSGKITHSVSASLEKFAGVFYSVSGRKVVTIEAPSTEDADGANAEEMGTALVVRDAKTLQPVSNTAPRHWISQLVFSADSKLAVTVRRGGMSTYRVRTGSLVNSLRGSWGAIRALSLEKPGTAVFLAGGGRYPYRVVRVGGVEGNNPKHLSSAKLPHTLTKALDKDDPRNKASGLRDTQILTDFTQIVEGATLIGPAAILGLRIHRVADGTFVVLSTKNHRRILTLPTAERSDGLQHTTISGDGQVAVGSLGETITWWTVPEGKVLNAGKVRGAWSILTTSTRGKFTVAAGTDANEGNSTPDTMRPHFLVLYEGRNRRARVSFAVHHYVTTALAISPDTRIIVSADHTGVIVFWDRKDLTPIVMRHSEAGRVNSLVFTPDGRQVASVNADGTASLWTVPKAVAQQR